jgi:hypothetical protein
MHRCDHHDGHEFEKKATPAIPVGQYAEHDPHRRAGRNGIPISSPNSASNKWYGRWISTPIMVQTAKQLIDPLV